MKTHSASATDIEMHGNIEILQWHHHCSVFFFIFISF